MSPDVESVWPVIVGGDLHRKSYAIANILNERVSSPVIAFSNPMRND
jgi:hypothetical protein